MWVAVTILALVLFGALLGTMLNFAGVFLAIPFFFIAVGFFVTREQIARQRRVAQLHRFRKSAQARQTDFTTADKRTVV